MPINAASPILCLSIVEVREKGIRTVCPFMDMIDFQKVKKKYLYIDI